MRHTSPTSFVKRYARLLAGGAMAVAMTAGGAMAQQSPVTPEPVEEGDASLFSSRVLTTGLAEPWEMVWGPDDFLWLTERAGGRVIKVNPHDGSTLVLLTVDEVHVGPQHEGLLGMALHPELLQGTGNDYVYLAYTYNGAAAAPGEADAQDAGGGDAAAGAVDTPLDRRAKIVRYTYDPETEQLGEPMELLSGLEAWDDHNAGRLVIGPDMKLYYTTGELGGNQGRNYQRPIRAQQLPTAEEVAAEDWNAYVGKVLRMNLDGSIPEDNPEIEGVRSHVYSYGHRNPQGLTFGPEGTIYSVEHGPSSDDELNVIEPGGNYGWPNVAGYVDDSAYLYANWSEAPADLRYNARDLPPEVPTYPESEFEPEVVEPLATYWTVPDDYDFSAGCGWICNPTIAPSSVVYYDAGENGIPAWDNSLLISTLKHGSIYVQPLSEDGLSTDGEVTRWFHTQNRYRDLVVGPDNRTIYVATDASGTTAQAYGDAGYTNVLHNPGAIMIFEYQGDEAGVASTSAPEGEPEAAAEEVSEAPAEPSDGIAEQAMMEVGRTIFSRNCRACHGPAGAGAQGPALAGNANLADTEHVVQTILFGFGYMPPFAGTLDDGEVAAVATYVRNAWGNEFGPVDEATVAAQR